MSLPQHVRSASDLVTPRAAIRDGFFRQALVKTEKAQPFLVQAQRLRSALQAADSPRDMTTMTDSDIRNSLLAAAGFSEKALGHARADPEQLLAALDGFLSAVDERAPGDWRDEILYCYLLTKGDSLGGSMRNYVGSTGGTTLATAILDALGRRQIEPAKTSAKRNQNKVVGLAWNGRRLLFDHQPGFHDKNIDAVLYAVDGADLNQWRCLACGELKGGFDPAGGDEHWKTARAAFDRIRQRFVTDCPALFFVGAAIERAMADEIFDDLQAGRLIYAANLTVSEQLNELADWLVAL